MRLSIIGPVLTLCLWMGVAASPPAATGRVSPAAVVAATDDSITVSGVVEEIDQDDLTVTILTDAGRLLSLSASGRDVISNLHLGDRVQIQITADDADDGADADRPSAETGPRVEI